MGKFQSPLLGYNNNVRHKGRVFHIQTEDSGVGKPHVITHLFMDGGRILKSVKKSYAEHVAQDDLNEFVRELMKAQHKAMFVALRDGEFDAMFDAGKKPASTPKLSSDAPSDSVTLKVSFEKPTPPPEKPISGELSAVAMPVPAPALPAFDDPPPADKPPAAKPPPEKVAALAKSAFAPPSIKGGDARVLGGRRSPAPMAAVQPSLSLEPALPPEIEALLREDPIEVAPPTSRVEASATDPKGAPARSVVHELTLDFDAIERDTEVSLFRPDDLPPPPKNLFARDALNGSNYRNARPVKRDDEAAPARAPARPEPKAAPPPRAESVASSTLDADLFHGSKPTGSIFGGDEHVGDKSLDEVILSYLSEDLKPRPRK
jgi:hypothetical protein